jgi:hypothetical protein
VSKPRAKFEVFRGTFATWTTLFSEAAHFAGVIGPDRVISISHSATHSDGVVTVWYWA